MSTNEISGLKNEVSIFLHGFNGYSFRFPSEVNQYAGWLDLEDLELFLDALKRYVFLMQKIERAFIKFYGKEMAHTLLAGFQRLANSMQEILVMHRERYELSRTDRPEILEGIKRISIDIPAALTGLKAVMEDMLSQESLRYASIADKGAAFIQLPGKPSDFAALVFQHVPTEKIFSYPINSPKGHLLSMLISSELVKDGVVDMCIVWKRLILLAKKHAFTRFDPRTYRLSGKQAREEHLRLAAAVDRQLLALAKDLNICLRIHPECKDGKWFYGGTGKLLIKKILYR